jgi:hypothetical protein
MGTWHTFHCAGCGYHAEVSGGDDRGMDIVTSTVVCVDCRALYDVFMGTSDSGDHPFKQPKFRCPKRSSHRIQKWEDGGPCPVCGCPMENMGPTAIWD